MSDKSGIRPLERPERCPGAYVLHLYCRYENPAHGHREFPWEPEFCQTRGEAVTQARQAGWIVHRDDTATCPKCAKSLSTPQGAPS